MNTVVLVVIVAAVVRCTAAAAAAWQAAPALAFPTGGAACHTDGERLVVLEGSRRFAWRMPPDMQSDMPFAQTFDGLHWSVQACTHENMCGLVEGARAVDAHTVVGGTRNTPLRMLPNAALAGELTAARLYDGDAWLPAARAFGCTVAAGGGGGLVHYAGGYDRVDGSAQASVFERSGGGGAQWLDALYALPHAVAEHACVRARPAQPASDYVVLGGMVGGQPSDAVFAMARPHGDVHAMPRLPAALAALVAAAAADGIYAGLGHGHGGAGDGVARLFYLPDGAGHWSEVAAPAANKHLLHACAAVLSPGVLVVAGGYVLEHDWAASSAVFARNATFSGGLPAAEPPPKSDAQLNKYFIAVFVVYIAAVVWAFSVFAWAVFTAPDRASKAAVE